MIDAARLLDALEVPAALVDPTGAVREANAAFRALDAREFETGSNGAAAEGWRAAPVGDGLRLLTAPDPRLARRARMLATLSHEVRTPLNGVLGMAGLLAATRLDATQAAYLATLRASGEHLLSLVEEVLDYARLDAGRVELEPAATDVEHLLQTVCELLSPRAHAAGLEIAWAAEGASPPRVIADDGRLRQVLFNLAGNAVKLTAAGGVLLTVAHRAAPNAAGAVTLRFSVRDTGPGLDRAAQTRVWEEFEQADDGARAGGAGLGLAIVRRLSEAFGGRLGVQSRPGEGALFWFEAEFARVADAAVSASVLGSGALAGITVGLVSPSPVVVSAAALQVEAEGGRVLRLDAAAHADDPARGAADVLLVDAAADALAPPPPGAPALVLLAAEARDRVPAAQAMGYAGWLIKPLRRASVSDRVRAVLGRGAASPASSASPGPAAEDERGAPAAAAGLRVLLAEDNAVNALLARALLQREGCQVERVATGDEAVAAARAGGFDLVLMDLRMPGLDGLAATTALRAAGGRTPVVALTANAFDDDRRACREAGLDGFLTKPLDVSALRAVLARWGRAEGRSAA